MNYYKEIKDILIKNESYKRVKDYSKNRNDLNSYYEVGRILVEAQGGEARAKYGNKLIKVYSEKLTKELGKGYTTTSLKRMRQFYLMIQNGAPMAHQLSWSHYQELLPLKDIKKIIYYINISIKYNISRNILRMRIKSNEYERIGYKEELENPKVNTLIKNPIIIKTNQIVDDNIKEYTLHKYILEDIDSFLKELGQGFTYVGHEYKIKINNTYHSIDFLLFNIKFNCYVIIEIKITEIKPEYIGQVLKYVNYIDKHIKEMHNDKSVGIVICKKDNKYVMEYCSDTRIFTTTYKVQSI